MSSAYNHRIRSHRSQKGHYQAAFNRIASSVSKKPSNNPFMRLIPHIHRRTTGGSERRSGEA